MYSNLLIMSVPDECYSNLLIMSVPDEGYSNLFITSVPDECYSNLLIMSVPVECYSNLLIMSIPDEGYSRNVSCTLNLISPFLFHKYDLLRTPLCSYLLPAYLFYLRHMSITFILYLPDQSLTQNNQCYPLCTYLFSFWDNTPCY